MKAAEFAKYVNMNMQPNEQPRLTSSYRIRSLLSSAAVRAEPKLSMKKLGFEKEVTMYVQETMKEITNGKLLLETGRRASAREMKDEDLVDESGPTAYLTLSEEGTTATTKLVKVMAAFCSIDNVDFKHLVV